MTPKPPWLDDEPAIRKLLDAFVDRLNDKPQEQRSRAVRIRLTSTVIPSLFRHDAASDHQWTLLQSLGGEVFDIELDRKRTPYAAEFEGAKLRLRPEAEPLLREWLGRPRQRPYVDRWRQAVASHAECFADGGQALADRPITLSGKTPDELVAAFAAMAHYIDSPLTLRQLSGRCFWGLSKFLDEREELVRALYPDVVLRPRPVLVHVHLPADPDGVLFIENQDTYLRAIEGLPSETVSLALVYVAGYRGSAERIREREGASLHFHSRSDESGRPAFESWWFDGGTTPGPLAFWGDLDFSGMAILKVLRQRFGHVRAWRPGYAPMLRRVLTGRGHEVALAGKEGQTDPGATGCEYADGCLLPAIRQKRAFDDQESL